MITGGPWEGKDSEFRLAQPPTAAEALVRGGHQVTHPAVASSLGLSYRAQGQIAGP